MKKIALALSLGFCICLNAQAPDPDLLTLKSRLDSIAEFTAQVSLEVDISFVNMPVKQAGIYYEKGKPVKITSEDFVMVPKRGLDFNLSRLLTHDYLTLDLGRVTVNGISCKSLRIVPTGEKADFSIASLFLDPELLRLVRAEISTKKHGVFTVDYAYADSTDVLPAVLEVGFAVSGVKIPLRFLGKEADIDRSKLKEKGEEQGLVRLRFSDYDISR